MNFTLITKAKELLKGNWDVQVQHAFREANEAADWLAHFGLSRNSFDRNDWILSDPLPELYSFCILTSSGPC